MNPDLSAHSSKPPRAPRRRWIAGVSLVVLAVGVLLTVLSVQRHGEPEPLVASGPQPPAPAKADAIQDPKGVEGALAKPRVSADPPPPLRSAEDAVDSPVLPAEALLGQLYDPALPPREDLAAVQRVITGYFSVVKEAGRFPIGGNQDLAAALRGENANGTVFLPASHPAFGPDGQILDRWGTPLIVHPLAWRVLSLRSAGPDRQPWTEDDLVMEP